MGWICPSHGLFLAVMKRNVCTQKALNLSWKCLVIESPLTKIYFKAQTKSNAYIFLHGQVNIYLIGLTLEYPTFKKMN